uniref:Uncharacterized protein n=1 Tax=Culex tarsalis TaxID=7177 RepID=A0A1Q3EZP9_CULTA
MITKSARLNLSNNESIADVSAISTCGRSEVDTNSSEPSNEEPPVQDASAVQGAAVLVDSVYIENKIKSLLSQEDHESSSKEATSAQEATTELPKPAPIGGILTAEDSCNAVDNKISSDDSGSNELAPEELSFNGKIKGLNEDNGSRGESTAANNSKVNREKLNESFELLTKENSSLMHYNNEKSPDLFADDDDDDEEDEDPSKSDPEDVEEDKSFNVSIPGSASTMGQVDQMERAILKRLQASLSGVLPPPSVTYSRIDVHRMITLYKENEASFCYRKNDAAKVDELTESTTAAAGSLNKPTHSMAELQQMEWPQLLQLRAHGVCYNRSTVTEKIELLGLKYIDRYIGSETGSTFNVPRSPSSAKKRNLRFKMLNQSPGSRLSHLARRRAVFSSANLLNTSHGSTSAASTSSSQSSAFRLCNRQILLDPKKSNNRRKNKGRTPKRRTPGRRKTPRRKTPGSSAKKRATLSLPVAKPALSTVNRETSKRALFQSPPNEAKASTSSSAAISSATASRVQKSKRALFSPPKRALRFSSVTGSRPDLSVKESLLSSSSQRYGSSNNIDTLPDSGLRNLATGESIDLGESSGKRRREDDGEPRYGKMPRIDSSSAINEEDLTPRSLKMARSQSFCVGSQNLSTKSVSETSFGGRSLFRANSEVGFPDSNPARPVTVLTENHKKKLLWAVSQALQSKQISVKHEQFKAYASSLARVVKRLFLEFNDQTVASTSEKLLRLANKNVFDVIQGRSVDDIYLREKTRLLNARNQTKLQGYIAPEEYEQRKQAIRRSTSTSTLLSETSSLAAHDGSQQLLLSQSSVFSQSSEFLNQLSQTTTTTTAASVLRENIDSELRQKSSAQKQVSFSGKDQKNLSPYADQKGGSNGSHVKTKLLVGGVATPSILKAKRQISFE